MALRAPGYPSPEVQLGQISSEETRHCLYVNSHPVPALQTARVWPGKKMTQAWQVKIDNTYGILRSVSGQTVSFSWSCFLCWTSSRLGSYPRSEIAIDALRRKVLEKSGRWPSNRVTATSAASVTVLESIRNESFFRPLCAPLSLCFFCQKSTWER